MSDTIHQLVSLLMLWQLPFSLGIRRIPDGHWGEFKPQRPHRRLPQSNVQRRVSVPNPSSPDDHLVTDLPLLDKSKFPTSHWAGLLPAADDGENYFFYWLFAPDDGSGQDVDFSDRSIPLVIWLNGGPACSSMDGLWLENGPFRLTKHRHGTWSIEIDEYSWHKSPAYVLYIDQPVGTGISFTTNKKYPTNDEEVNTAFYYFLNQFLILHKDKFLDESSSALNRPLYFSGESHAGHYIPSMMNYIQKKNEKSPSLQIPLSGAAIGNGWIDPPAQYSAHEAAYGKGLIGLAQKRALIEDEIKCQTDLARGKFDSGHCVKLLDVIVDNSQGDGSAYHISQYDARKTEHKGGSRTFPKGHKDVEAYLGGIGGSYNKVLADIFKDVLESIHSTPSLEAGQEYEECTDPPFLALKHQDGLGVTNDIVDLLNNGIRMLFFNGIEDMICNHVGNEIAVENLQWKAQREYQGAPRYGWEAPSRKLLAGYMKEHENLMYLKVKDSGHMVPMDVPDIALDMIRTMIYNKKFDDYEQLIARREKEDPGSGCPVCSSSSSANDASCPKCASCSSEAGDSVSTKSWNEWTATSPATLISGSVLIAWALALCVYMACCRSKPQYHRAPDGGHGMEMTSGYTDKAGDEYVPYEEEAVEFT